MTLKFQLLELRRNSDINYKPLSRMVKWDKIDLIRYRELVKISLNKRKCSDSIEEENNRLKNVLKDATDHLVPDCKRGKSQGRPQLNVWNAEIYKNLKSLRRAVRLWTEAGKPCDALTRLASNVNSVRRYFEVLLGVNMPEGSYKIEVTFSLHDSVTLNCSTS